MTPEQIETNRKWCEDWWEPITDEEWRQYRKAQEERFDRMVAEATKAEG